LRFNSTFAFHYRKNGYLFITYDPKTSYYDIYIKRPAKVSVWVECQRNKIVAIKQAKRLAMIQKLGFNEEIDVA
jgi:hypothetical protein